MTVRNDLTVDWFASPRIITVAAPSTEITIQDLLDTCRELEDDVYNMVYDPLASAAGKENLGGGVRVGITLTLLNAVLAFEARPGPTYVQCRVAGGNLVAVDGYGDDISPIYPTAFTQVLTTASSSATLQEQTDIQYSSFEGAVHILQGSPYTGTAYPNGTPRQPVNNFEDAMAIAISRGIESFHITGNMTINSGINYNGFHFRGRSPTKTILTLDSSATLVDCEFENAYIQGTLDGSCKIYDCTIGNLSYIDGVVENCVLTGTITLSGLSTATFLDCHDGLAGPQRPIIDVGAGSDLIISEYHGGITITNKTGNDDVSIDLNSGRVIIENTVTAGHFIIRGIGEVVDNSVGTTTVDATSLLSNTSVQAQTKYLIESLRPDHMGFGKIFYWDPVNGDDANHSGLLPDNAKKTFAATQTLCLSGRGDTIFIVNEQSGALLISEPIIITTDGLNLRGGTNMLFMPLDDGYDTITILGNNVSVSGLQVTTGSGVTPRNGIFANNVNALRLENFGIINSSGNGVKITGGIGHQINRFSIDTSGAAGLLLTDTKTCTVTNGLINDGYGWGVDIVSTFDGGAHINNFDYLVVIHNEVGGVRVGNNSHLTLITERCHIGESSSQPIRLQDNGQITYDLVNYRATALTNKILDEPIASHNIAGSVGEALANAGLTPEQAKQLLIVFLNSL